MTYLAIVDYFDYYFVIISKGVNYYKNDIGTKIKLSF